jgi:sulfhydrogenase subunit beta (sulfur reductase)
MSLIRIPAARMEKALGELGWRVMAPSGSGRKGKYVEVPAGGKLPRECGDHTKPSAPPKGIVWPNNEVLLSYSLGVKGEIEVKGVDHTMGMTVLYGTPPCDSASFRVLDAALLRDAPEPGYAAKRESFGVIGMACSRQDRYCLCTSVGLSPHSTAGADLMVYPDGDDLVVQKLTGRLDKLWAMLEHGAGKVTDDAFKAVAKKFDFQVENFAFDAEKLAETLRKGFDSNYWKEFSERCVSCGICTFLCPTCHCFDIADSAADERNGRRVRTWDTCQFPEFTGETSAHNPRRDRWARQRQRVLHKFLYHFQNLGHMMCTGCGRCIRYCPVDINIAEGVMRLGGMK